ncbi:hypothetical protein EXU85_20640 [Spirosoma sp. KCTC 42546]|uniref:hypothetical protein n=1 Tax=Spirosoma sp. KCTC 42546 TaxID=2520506 RepID=UPI00115BD924|nr:hypothetical protein [Spirosoma sp. KCTC 42546]QDK80889.1 hypothetical protein EXU85_20640 [Spirosoma sp. KCTC 42546]
MKHIIETIKSLINNLSLKEAFGLLSVLITILAILASLTSGSFRLVDTQLENARTQKFLDGVKKELSDTRNDIRYLRLEMKSLEEIKDSKLLATAFANYRIKEAHDSLNKRFSKIEYLLNQDIEKSLEIPILRKDLEHFNEINESEISHIKSDIDKTNTLILSSLFAIAVGVFTQFLSKKNRKSSI